MKKYFPIAVLLGCAALFAFGVVQLFKLRFEAGDVYPPYSSLRTDPLGTMAFYESLGKLPGLSVRRDMSASGRLPEEPDTAYLHLAAEAGEWRNVPVDLFRDLKDFLARGNRLVITDFPLTTQPFYFPSDREADTNSAASKRLKSKSTNAPPVISGKSKKQKPATGDTSWLNLEEEWKFHEGYAELEQDGDHYAPARVVNRSGLPLPQTLDWHSAMIFTNCDAAWRTIYTRGTNAVVLERTFGRGSVVLASDSYFLSNEAMLKDRHADLLAWLVGASRNVVFDEAHLGIAESPGVAALMRKYRLHGLAAGLLLLAGLFIWKNATCLVPRFADEPRSDFVGGRDIGSGFVNLLRRSVPPREIFPVCFAEWQKSAAVGKIPGTRRRQAEALFQSENALPSNAHDPVAAYKKISEILDQHRSTL